MFLPAHTDFINQYGCASHSDAGKQMQDITGAECVEVLISDNGKVLWVNTENGCVLRICQMKTAPVVIGLGGRHG
jgi:hypothetical protein